VRQLFVAPQPGALSGADHRGPRVDLHDLEELCPGEPISPTSALLAVILVSPIRRNADPIDPIEAVRLARHLAALSGSAPPGTR
jgi:hypothetical protein